MGRGRERATSALMEGKLELTRGAGVGVRGAKFLRVGHARMCTGGPSAGGARTVRGADVARLDLVVVD